MYLCKKVSLLIFLLLVSACDSALHIQRMENNNSDEEGSGGSPEKGRKLEAKFYKKKLGADDWDFLKATTIILAENTDHGHTYPCLYIGLKSAQYIIPKKCETAKNEEFSLGFSSKKSYAFPYTKSENSNLNEYKVVFESSEDYSEVKNFLEKRSIERASREQGSRKPRKPSEALLIKGIDKRIGILDKRLRRGDIACAFSNPLAHGLFLPYMGSKDRIAENVVGLINELFEGERNRKVLISPFSGLASVELEYAKSDPTSKVILNDLSNFPSLIHRYKMYSRAATPEQKKIFDKQVLETVAKFITEDVARILGIDKTIKYNSGTALLNLEKEAELKHFFLRKKKIAEDFNWEGYDKIAENLIEATASAVFCCLFSHFHGVKNPDLTRIINALKFADGVFKDKTTEKVVSLRLEKYLKLDYPENVDFSKNDFKNFLDNLSIEPSDTCIYFFDPPYEIMGKERSYDYGVRGNSFTKECFRLINQILKERPGSLVLFTNRDTKDKNLLHHLACNVPIQYSKGKCTRGESLYIFHQDEDFRRKIQNLVPRYFSLKKEVLSNSLPNFAEGLEIMSAQNLPGSLEEESEMDIEKEDSMLLEEAA